MNNDGALLLAKAIIVQQAKDYKAALRKCRKNSWRERGAEEGEHEITKRD